MPHPWNPDPDEEETYDHDTIEKDGIVKCKRCGKRATAERRLRKTPYDR